MPSIRKTAELVQEVTAASTEQSTGVGQLNNAMGQVDQVTQRNASAAEELSSTAEEMAAQAAALKEQVSYFRLPGDERSQPGPVARPAIARASAPTTLAPVAGVAHKANGRAGSRPDGHSQPRHEDYVRF